MIKALAVAIISVFAMEASALTFATTSDGGKEVDWAAFSAKVGTFETDYAADIVFEPKSNRQHYAFRDFIATPYRDLVVPSNFSLIDDYEQFIGFHYDLFVGRVPDSGGEIERLSKLADVDKCAASMGTAMSMDAAYGVATTWSDTMSAEIPDIVDIGSACGRMLQQRFLHNPKKGIENYKSIILAWLENGRIANVNAVLRKLPKTISVAGNYSYFIQRLVTQVMTHYAFYHRDYGFDADTTRKIIAMTEQFYVTFDLYESYSKISSRHKRVCDLESTFDVVRGINDYCGSNAFRMAVGAILFGLEFENQNIFDAGVRNLEVKLATLNKHAIYAGHAHRGCAALAYSQQMVPMTEMVQFAFQKAFGIDFISQKNVHGVTPAEVYEKQWHLAHNPLELEKYVLGKGQGTCGRAGLSFADAIAKLKKRKGAYRLFWEAWSREHHIIRAPSLAQRVFPDRFRTYNNLMNNDLIRRQVAKDKDSLSIDPFFLRVATGYVELSDTRVAREKREKLEQQARVSLKLHAGDYNVRLTQTKEARPLSWGTVQLTISEKGIIVNGSFPDETQPHLSALSPKFDENGFLRLDGQWRMARKGYQCMQFRIDLGVDGAAANKCDAPGHLTELHVYKRE